MPEVWTAAAASTRNWEKLDAASPAGLALGASRAVCVCMSPARSSSSATLCKSAKALVEQTMTDAMRSWKQQRRKCRHAPSAVAEQYWLE